MQYIWKYVDELVGKGLEIHVVLELLFYASATFVALAVPLAVLLSSLMAFGNLGENYEIVALKSAGIPLTKLYLPLFFFVSCISVFTFFFTDQVAPKSYYKMRSLLSDIRDTKPTLTIEEGVFFTGFDDVTIRVGKKESDNVTIHDVLIYDHSKHRANVTMTYAKKGKMQMTEDKQNMLFTLYDGFYWDESKNAESKSPYPLTRSVFKEQYKRFDLSSFEFHKTDDDFYKTHHQALSNSEIKKELVEMEVIIDDRELQKKEAFKRSLYYLDIYTLQRNKVLDTMCLEPQFLFDSMDVAAKKDLLNYAKMLSAGTITSLNSTNTDIKWRSKQYRTAQIEMHKKYSLAIACLLFFFIGAPLGSIIRKGGIGIPLVITVLAFAFYFMFSITGEKMAASGVLPLLIGPWMSTVIFFSIGAFLVYKATIDSSLLATEEYKKWLMKFPLIKRLFKKKTQ